MTLLLLLALLGDVEPPPQAPEPPVPEAEAPDPDRWEPSLIPALGYDTDTGLGFGAIGSLARFRPGASPYAWRLEALFFMTVKEIPGAGTDSPFHDDYLKIDIPDLAGGDLRLGFALAFQRYTNAGYYGVGTFAPFAPERQQEVPRYYQYDRIMPRVEGSVRLTLARANGGILDLFGRLDVRYVWINLYPGSKLAEDLVSADPVTQRLLVGVDDHALAAGTLGWIYDTRDHETAPTRGFLAKVSGRAGAGIDQPIVYGGLTGGLRIFIPVAPPYLVVASRVLVDALFGRPPFYALADHGGLTPSGATGGATSIRGIWAQRYHGKLKLLGNLELRSKLLPFSVFGQRFNLGLIGFVDAGRIWAELRARGQSGVWRVGTGGGMRFQWGETFILRGDVATSPTDGTWGLYIGVSHIF